MIQIEGEVNGNGVAQSQCYIANVATPWWGVNFIWNFKYDPFIVSEVLTAVNLNSWSFWVFSAVQFRTISTSFRRKFSPPFSGFISEYRNLRYSCCFLTIVLKWTISSLLGALLSSRSTLTARISLAWCWRNQRLDPPWAAARPEYKHEVRLFPAEPELELSSFLITAGQREWLSPQWRVRNDCAASSGVLSDAQRDAVGSCEAGRTATYILPCN